VFGQSSIGKGRHLSAKVLVLLWSDRRLDATSWGTRGEIASIAAGGMPALEACKTDLEGADNLRAWHTTVEGGEHPLA
jgi:hypothetical protein